MPRPPRPHSKLADDVKVETDLVPSGREAEASARAFREQEAAIYVDDEISQFSNPQCKAKRRVPVLPAPGEVSFGEWVKLGTSPMNAKAVGWLDKRWTLALSVTKHVMSPIAQRPVRSKEAAQGRPRSLRRKRAAADVREPETAAAVSKQRRGSCAVKPGMATRGGKLPPDVPERMEEPTFAPAEDPPQDLQAPPGPSNLQPVPSEMPQEEELQKSAPVVDKGSFGAHAPSFSAALTSKPEAPLGPLKHVVKERPEERAAPCSGPVTAVLSLQQQERVHSLIQVSEAFGQRSDLFGYDASECVGARCDEVFGSVKLFKDKPGMAALNKVAAELGLSDEQATAGIKRMIKAAEEAAQAASAGGSHPTTGWQYHAGLSRDVSDRISLAKLLKAASSENTRCFDELCQAMSEFSLCPSCGFRV
eukprot:s944_g7.t3